MGVFVLEVASIGSQISQSTPKDLNIVMGLRVVGFGSTDMGLTTGDGLIGVSTPGLNIFGFFVIV